MIRDLSETMRAVLDDPGLASSFPELAAAQILFDRPADTFSPAQTTVNLFLYDVRENMELRSNEPIIERNNGQATIYRAPMRVLCSYLLTAWPVGGAEPPLQEHRLLSQALQVLSRYPTIPAQYLKGRLVGQEPPLPMITAQTDGLKNPAEFWTALGNKLRPSLSITATISMQAFEPDVATMATVSDVRVGERTSAAETKISAATLQGPFTITGRVADASGAAVAGATVTISELGLLSTTDAGGVYSLTMLPPGAYTLVVKKGAGTQNFAIAVPAPAGSNYNLKLTG